MGVVEAFRADGMIHVLTVPLQVVDAFPTDRGLWVEARRLNSLGLTEVLEQPQSGETELLLEPLQQMGYCYAAKGGTFGHAVSAICTQLWYACPRRGFLLRELAIVAMSACPGWDEHEGTRNIVVPQQKLIELLGRSKQELEAEMTVYLLARDSGG